MSRSSYRVLLAAGFLAVAVGVHLAWRSPAGSYESSIYLATPAGFWASLGVAFAVAVASVLVTSGRDQAFAVGLGALSTVAIVSLPVVRGYQFLGYGDALTHLGWTTDIEAGALSSFDLLYPGIHVLGLLFSMLTGVSLDRALLVGVTVLFVPFVLFAPLVARQLTGDPLAVGATAVVSWFVLPINTLATHMGPHTNSNALFLVPVVLFSIIAYLRRDASFERFPGGGSSYLIVALLTGLGTLIVHPQQMMNVLVVLATIYGLQFLARRLRADHPMAMHRSVLTLTGILGVAFIAWVATNPRFQNAVRTILENVFVGDLGGPGAVDQRGASLVEVGGSFPEVFAKLFLVSTLVGFLVGMFLLSTWFGVTALDGDARSLVTYLGLSFVPLSAIFGLYFLGTSMMAFRQLGFIYVVVTILAGPALAATVGTLGRAITLPGATTITAAVLAACLVLSLATLFASPYIYSPSSHVNDRHYEGYATALDVGEEDTEYAGYGRSIVRHVHVVNGVERDDHFQYIWGLDGTVDPETFEAGAYDQAYGNGSYYLTVSEYDTTREIEVYNELHHSEAGLTRLESNPEASKVVSNEEFSLYRIDPVE